MKTTLLRLSFFLVFTALASEAYADYGSIILHKAKFVLKNGSSVTGYVPLSDYNISMEDYKDMHPDKAFQKLINTYFFADRKTLQFQVFEQYNTLISPVASANPLDKEFLYTDAASVHTLHLDSINYTIYISAEDKPCLLWRNIEVFAPGTVDLMAHDSVQHFTTVNLFNSDNYFVNAHIFCFNPNLSDAAFREAIQNFGKNVLPDRRSDPTNYREAVKALEKMGIVVFFGAEGSC